MDVSSASLSAGRRRQLTGGRRGELTSPTALGHLAEREIPTISNCEELTSQPAKPGRPVEPRNLRVALVVGGGGGGGGGVCVCVWGWGGVLGIARDC